MIRLEMLGLDHNIIEHLESDVFNGLVNLNVIILQGNKLQYLHPDTFLGLSVFQGLQMPTDPSLANSIILKHLAISVCNVRSVSVKTFANVSALIVLDLSYNNLKSVDINILKVLPNLSAMDLYDNPLQCDCQLQEVWRWCKDNNIKTANKEFAPECDTPSEVKGMWWGVLEKGQCLEGNMKYYGDYKNTMHTH
jgi:Leucine-rich repeat (LRR) protein